MSKTFETRDYRGKKNIYRCGNGHWVVTIDRDEGVTPFMIPCEDYGRAGCPLSMTSAFYRVDQDAEPTHEWYRPENLLVYLRKYVTPRNHQATREHIEKGGLVLRKIS